MEFTQRNPQLDELHKGREPEMVESEAQREPQLDNLNRGREPDVEFKAQRKPQLDELHKGREPEIAEFDTQREPQLDDVNKSREPELESNPHLKPRLGETVVQQTRRDEAIWLEERPKVIDAIKSGVAVMREMSAQMRAKRANQKRED